MNIKENEKIFSKGSKVTNNFTGEAWVDMLSDDIKTYDAMVYNVTFAPRSRNNWHSHPKGQILLCTSGKGYFQENGKHCQLLKSGDVVEIKPGILHWHGATPESEFTHIGITPSANENVTSWYEPVSDEEYNSCNQK